MQSVQDEISLFGPTPAAPGQAQARARDVACRGGKVLAGKWRKILPMMKHNFEICRDRTWVKSEDRISTSVVPEFVAPIYLVSTICDVISLLLDLAMGTFCIIPNDPQHGRTGRELESQRDNLKLCNFTGKSRDNWANWLSITFHAGAWLSGFYEVGRNQEFRFLATSVKTLMSSL